MKRRGQVWIETVIYTLIAFVMIALILAFARPKIQELQDNAILQQSTQMLKEVDSIILNMGAAGNQRIVEINVKAGDLKLDCINDKIIFELKSPSVYSEPGKNISDGSVIILTQKQSGNNLVTLTRDYSSGYDLKFEGRDEVKQLSISSSAYKLAILNEGKDANDKTILNMSLA
ncbi:Uncharacterised protein [uncultured archaeon]|nr:Uncharacterised protein [uncultured archaeon]